jgi:hypothetical protein
MKALLICTNGDGRITNAERDWILGIASAMGAPESLVEQLKSYKATESLDGLLASGVETGKFASRSLIYNAIRACSTDGELGEGELDSIDEVASDLNVPKTVVDELKDIVAQEAKLRERRLKLVFPEGIPY